MRADLNAVAGRQYGVVTNAQLRELGWSRGRIGRQISSGLLVRLHRGVYSLSPDIRPEARWLAAVLAGGEGAVLSNRSAAALWGFRHAEFHRPEVTAPRLRRHAGIVAHQGRLAAADVTVHRGIPVTTVARTLADLAHTLDEDDFRRAAREAQFLKLWDAAAIADALERRPSRVLRRLIPQIVTKSRMEDRFLRICRRHRLPEPVRQHRIDGHDYDVAWPGPRVVVETDSWGAHSGPHAFQADRARTNALGLRGWTVLRLTWADLTDRPERVAATVRAALA